MPLLEGAKAPVEGVAGLLDLLLDRLQLLPEPQTSLLGALRRANSSSVRDPRTKSSYPTSMVPRIPASACPDTAQMKE